MSCFCASSLSLLTAGSSGPRSLLPAQLRPSFTPLGGSFLRRGRLLLLIRGLLPHSGGDGEKNFGRTERRETAAWRVKAEDAGAGQRTDGPHHSNFPALKRGTWNGGVTLQEVTILP